MHITKKSLAVLGALITALCTVTAATALAGTPSPDAARPAQVHKLSGTWVTTVEISDAPPGVPVTFNALNTFSHGGGLVVSSSAPNPATRSLAHGSWTHTDHQNYTASFTWFRFDASGAYIGTQRVQREMTLSHHGQRFSATDVIEIIAPTGAVVATLHATETGTLLGE